MCQGKGLGKIFGKGDIDEDINQCVNLVCQKWRNALRVLCDKKILGELKGKVYHMAVKLWLND